MIIAGNTVIELNDEQMNIVLSVVRGLSVSPATPSRIETPFTPVVPVAKTYEHVSEDFTDFVFVVKDNKVSYTHKDGTYLHEKAVRKVLNERIKSAGGSYVDKCWEFNKGNKRDIKGAKDFVANHSNVVTADEINAIRDGWTEKSAKRVSKAIK